MGSLASIARGVVGAARHRRRESDHECVLCEVRLENHRQTGKLLVFGGIFLLLPSFFLLLETGAGTASWDLALPAVLLAEFFLTVGLGGGGLLLAEWEVCPECADFRLPDDRYRQLVRIEHVFRRLPYYLFVPAGFLFVFSLRGPAILMYVPLDLFLGGVLALGFRDFWRPHRKEPVTWGCRRTGIRIPEDDG